MLSWLVFTISWSKAFVLLIMGWVQILISTILLCTYILEYLGGKPFPPWLHTHTYIAKLYVYNIKSSSCANNILIWYYSECYMFFICIITRFFSWIKFNFPIWLVPSYIITCQNCGHGTDMRGCPQSPLQLEGIYSVQLQVHYSL